MANVRFHLKDVRGARDFRSAQLPCTYRADKDTSLPKHIPDSIGLNGITSWCPGSMALEGRRSARSMKLAQNLSRGVGRSLVS